MQQGSFELTMPAKIFKTKGGKNRAKKRLFKDAFGRYFSTPFLHPLMIKVLEHELRMEAKNASA